MPALVLILLLSLIVLTTTLLLRLARDTSSVWVQPTTLFTVPWILALIVYALPIFTFREHLEMRHVLYIGVAHFAFAIGVILAGTWRTSSHLRAASQPDPFQLTRKALWIILALGLFGNLSIVLDAVITSNLSLTDRLQGGSLSVVRNEQFAAQIQGVVGPFHRWQQFAPLSLLGLVLCMLAPAARSVAGRSRLFKIVIFTTAVLYVFNGLFVRGGRMDLVILILVFVVAVALDPDRRFQRWLKSLSFLPVAALGATLLLLLAGALVYFSTGFVQARSGGTSGLLSLTQHHRMDVAPWIGHWLGYSTPIQYGLLTLSYVVSPLVTFAYYFDLHGASFPGPYWGQYNFPMLAPRIMRIFQADTIRYWWDIRFDIFMPLTFQGFGGNVWATNLRDLAVDFGWAGVPLVTGLMGFFSKLALRLGIAKRSPLLIASYCIFAPALMLSFAHSLLFVQSLFGAFFLSLVVMAIYVVRARFGVTRKRRLPSVNIARVGSEN